MQKVEYIEINKLTSHSNNPRVIKDEQFKKLCKSIQDNKDYFETRPILVNKELIIFAGNMRWRAAKEVGMTEVPVSIMDISENRQKELMIRDNRENGEWDFDLLANNFEIDDLLEWGFDEKDLKINDIDFGNINGNENRKTSDRKQNVTCPDCGKMFEV